MIKQTELSQTHYRALLYYQYKMSGSPDKLHDHWHNTKHYVGQELMNHKTNETITIKSIICIIEFMEHWPVAWSWRQSQRWMQWFSDTVIWVSTEGIHIYQVRV